MSHSRKNVNKNVLSLQRDLKRNYTKIKLNILANHYSISPHLNKDQLTMKIAQANFKHAKTQRARMWPSSSSSRADISPIGIELQTFEGTRSNEHLNKQVLTEARQECMQRLDKLEQDFQTSFGTIRDKRTELFDALQKGLQAEPAAFSQIIPKVISSCHNELEEILTCISQALEHTETSAETKLRDIEQFLAGLPGQVESPLVPSVLFPIAEEEEIFSVTPPYTPLKAEQFVSDEEIDVTPEEFPALSPPDTPPLSAEQFEEILTPGPISLPPTPLSEQFGSDEEEGPTPTVTPDPVEFLPIPQDTPLSVSDEEEELVTPGPPHVSPADTPVQFVSTEEEIDQTPVPECENDEDCEAKREQGSLSGTLPRQRVICITKRDGSTDCAYQA